LDRLAQVVAAADKVAKVLACNFSFRLELGCLLLLELELFDVPLQTDAYIVSRAFECAPNLGADAKGVGVCVIDRR